MKGEADNPRAELGKSAQMEPPADSGSTLPRHAQERNRSIKRTADEIEWIAITAWQDPSERFKYQRVNAHREAAQFNEVVSARPAPPGCKRSRTPAVRIQLSSIDWCPPIEIIMYGVSRSCELCMVSPDRVVFPDRANYVWCPRSRSIDRCPPIDAIRYGVPRSGCPRSGDRTACYRRQRPAAPTPSGKLTRLWKSQERSGWDWRDQAPTLPAYWAA